MKSIHKKRANISSETPGLLEQLKAGQYSDSSVKGVVFNIMRYSVEDGPNLRTTVFLKGCPLECRWCHNPESRSPLPELLYRADRCIGCGECLEVCPEGSISSSDGSIRWIRERCKVCGRCVEACYSEARAIIGRELSVEEVMEELKKDLPFYEESGGGVTFSGGEPLMQPKFLQAMLKACKREEIHTAVDTSGAAKYAVFELIEPYVDLFLYDLKIMDDSKHLQETGLSNRQILGNLQRLSAAGKKIIIRIPIIPNINDDVENLSAMGKFIASLVKVPEVRLLPFHEAGMDKFRLLGIECRMPAAEPPSGERLEEVAEKLRQFGLNVSAGG